jgi:hypothetical protein
MVNQRVLIANALFRAVAIGPTHQINSRSSRLLLLRAAVSAISLLVVLAVIGRFVWSAWIAISASA